MRKPIVIIGGMGPSASVRLHSLILEKSLLYHKGHNDTYPYIVHYSVPVPDFLSDEQSRDQAVSMLQAIETSIMLLEPAIVALACNTAHLITDQVSYLRSGAFVSMIESVADTIQKDEVGCIGLIASPTTIRTKLYSDALTRRKIATIVPDKKLQQTTETIIRTVIRGETGGMSTRLDHIQSEVIQKGAEGILLGCTELPIIYQRQADVPVYDCLDIYADEIVARYYKDRITTDKV